MGFGLATGFTEHLQIVTTSNYRYFTLCSSLQHVLSRLSPLCLHHVLLCFRAHIHSCLPSQDSTDLTPRLLRPSHTSLLLFCTELSQEDCLIKVKAMLQRTVSQPCLGVKHPCSSVVVEALCYKPEGRRFDTR
jgi:hypothetical protein